MRYGNRTYSRVGAVVKQQPQKSVISPDGTGLTRAWIPGQREYNPLGKLPGSVWTIPTQPLPVPRTSVSIISPRIPWNGPAASSKAGHLRYLRGMRPTAYAINL